MHGHADDAPSPEVAALAMQEALQAIVSRPELWEYIEVEHPDLRERIDEALRAATGLRAVDHAVAERDRLLARLAEDDRKLLRQALTEWAGGRLTFVERSGLRSGYYAYATERGLVPTPWSRRVTDLISHEEFLKWAGLPRAAWPGAEDAPGAVA